MTTAVTSTCRSAEERARFQSISAVFRSWIEQDAREIRRARAELRDLQRRGSASAPARQSRLAHRRDEARAHLLAYGLHRGVALERMERGRTGLDQLPCRLPALIRRAAERAEEAAAAARTGDLPR